MPRRRHPTTKPPRPPRPPMKMPHRPRPRSPPRRISLFFRKRFVVVVEEWRRITAPELCAFEVAPLQRSCAVGAHLLQLKGLCRRGARLHAVSDLKVKHRAQVLRSFLFGRHSPFPERPEELDLRADKIHRTSAAEAACIFALLAEAGSFPSSVVAYAKRWSRDSGRSSLSRESAFGTCST